MRKLLGVAALFVLCGCGSTPQDPANAASGPDIVAHQGARLDVTFVPVTAESGAALKLDSDRGLLVAQVRPGGPAEKAGFARGDVLLSVDGSPVNTAADLRAAINAAAPHHKAKLALSRDGVVRNVTIPL
jgi:S1-C subfamily serine protease